jgi:simple sugar transport system ATP-binding protein/ribose transport system ATP-binding protein
MDDAPSTADTPAVEVRGVSKRFGGVQALRDVDLQVRRGSVHALVGENGAGKSTLGRIISGVLQPDAGELLIEGLPVRLRSPREALAAGTTTIAQEVAVLPQRSVAENVFLGMESNRCGLLRDRKTSRRYLELSRAVGFELPPNAKVGDLRLADQQKVEILRALARKARVVVMDEPTAALDDEDTEVLLETIRRVASSGTTVIYVSHFIDEVLRLADTVSVLRDGQLVHTAAAADETADAIVTAMLGRRFDLVLPERRPPSPNAPTALAVKGLSRAGAIRDVSFEVRAGEIVGLAGLVGSGRSEVARAIFGADARDEGEIWVAGRQVNPRTPRDGVRAGMALVPEDRKGQGLVMVRSPRENVTLADLASVSRLGLVSGRRQRQVAVELGKTVDAPLEAADRQVASLSGGNQQKVLFGKWLVRQPRVLIADEPTRGVDVGAKRAIYDLITRLAADGMAVLLISSELEEVLGLAHRVLVMRAGRLAAEFDASTDNLRESVMRAAVIPEAEAEAEAVA